MAQELTLEQIMKGNTTNSPTPTNVTVKPNVNLNVNPATQIGDQINTFMSTFVEALRQMNRLIENGKGLKGELPKLNANLGGKGKGLLGATGGGKSEAVKQAEAMMLGG